LAQNLTVGDFARFLAVDAILPSRRAKRSGERLGRFVVAKTFLSFFSGAEIFRVASFV
jgi:hypothetical protein